MLTPEQLTALHGELVNDPKGKGYAAFLPGDPVKVVDLICSLTETMIGPLRTTTAKAWAAQGPMSKIEDACNDTAHPCRASCLVIRQSFACGDPIHIEDSRLQEMLSAWVANSVATQVEVDALYQLANMSASRADVLGLPAPTARDIIDAWSNA